MSDRAFILALLSVAFVVALGSVLDLMEVDAAQYASMAREMMGSEDPLKLYHRGADYLDKPPLLFWLSAISFKLFGVFNWSYKLPSILFGCLGIYSTYRFALQFHGAEIARTAALMFASSAAFLLMTNDVRTDTILTGAVITAIWTGMAWVDQRKWWQLVVCATAIAAGMLAKGPMGLVAPVLAIGGHIIVLRRWDVLRDPRIPIAVAIIGLLLLPMCYGLLEQHGRHGLRFYFWEQSFGRITGENRWKDDSTMFFFTHELLWLMLPWTVFTLTGIWRSGRALFHVRSKPLERLPEYASIVGSLAVFIALSLSQFKLPHYLYVAVPLFSVLSAWAWHTAHGKALFNAQLVVTTLLWSAALVLVGWSFSEGALPFIGLLLAVPLFSFLSMRRTDGGQREFRISFWTMIAIAVCINTQIYPRILAFQANAQVGKIAQRKGLDASQFHGLQRSGTSLDFYAGFPVPWLSNADEAARVIRPGVHIWTNAKGLMELREAGFEPKEIEPFLDHPVQILGIEMLHPRERRSVLEECYLLSY